MQQQQPLREPESQFLLHLLQVHLSRIAVPEVGVEAWTALVPKRLRKLTEKQRKRSALGNCSSKQRRKWQNVPLSLVSRCLLR